LPEQLLEMPTVDVLIMMAYGLPYRAAMSAISEAKQRKIPIILITDTRDVAGGRHATVVVPVPCGHAGRINIRGATLVCLEAIAFGLIADDPPRTISSLERLSALRNAISK